MRAWWRRLPEARRLTVATPAGETQYLVAGYGSPVVLLHGLDGSARWWAPTMQALASRYRCYAPEFVRFARWREQGRVPLPRAGAFVTVWLEALGLEQTHLLAHSMGAHAALMIAARHPELVDRLVLIAPAVLSPGPRAPRELARTLGFASTLAPRFVPVLLADSLRTGPHRWLRSLGELLAAEPPDFAAVRAPTLLIWGSRDPLTPPAQGPLVRRRIAGARLLLLPGARHVPMYERPAACNEAIARFLAGEVVGES